MKTDIEVKSCVYPKTLGVSVGCKGGVDLVDIDNS